MTLRDQQKLEVQQASDLVRLIGEQVALKARGKEFLGLCPFHEDKNPSMHVSPAKQIYKCFSCGAGGDAFSFVMNYHKMTFPEALKYLAERAGIKLVDYRRQEASGKRQEGEEEGPTERERIGDANAKAVAFFQALYRHPEHGKTARDYIAKRGINAEMLEAFQIGYAPDRWDGLVMMIRDKGWDPRAFELAGLISPRNRDEPNQKSEIKDQKSFYDRLRHRLIFPIFDAIGRPIAFGGRKLREEDEPKYLNSPETALFNKSATLYGLHRAKKPIIDSKTAIIVEGYTDVIGCHQHGICNVVATLGTALTIQHVNALRHFADRVVLIFDPDEAGQKAADRAVEVFLQGSLDVFIAELPGDQDPDELLAQEDGRSKWDAAIAQASDALEYQFRRVREQYEAADTLAGRQRIAEDYLRRLGQAGLEKTGALRKSMIVSRLAEMLHLSEQMVQDLLKRLAPTPRSQPAASAPSDRRVGEMRDNGRPDVVAGGSGAKIRALAQAERHLIGCLLRDPGLFHVTLSDGRAMDEAITPAEFVSGRLLAAGDPQDPQGPPESAGRRVYERVYQRLSDGETVSLASVLADLAAEGQQELADWVTQADLEVEALVESDSEVLPRLLQTEADCLLDYHREQEHQRALRGLTAADAAGQGPSEQAQMLRQILEHRRANPSPARIARVKR